MRTHNKCGMNPPQTKLIRRILMLPFLLGFLAAASGLNAQRNEKEVAFGELWDLVKENSPSRKASLYEMKTLEAARSRYARHWLPRIYADARTFNTNDPSLTFMSVLGQRQATYSDFSTSSSRDQAFLSSPNVVTPGYFAQDTLNHPGQNTFQKGSIGVDLPIYEGGVKEALLRSHEKSLEIKGYEKQYYDILEFGNIASSYMAIQTIDRMVEQLNITRSEVSRIIQKYQVGSRSNPVGYSGLLGLKTLKNRLDAVITENISRRGSLRNSLELNAKNLPEGWTPAKENVFGFTNSHLTLPEKPNGNISFRTKAMKAMADNAEIQVSAERAKFLPKIGAFAEMNQYGGNRGTAGSYNAGVYLQMNLFSPSDYGAVDQAKLNSEAVRSRAEETKLKEETQLAQLLNSEIVLKTNIPLLQENLQLSEEQISTGRKLFLSGSITALQLAEILSRYTDILLSLAMAEQEYLNTRVALFALTYDGKKEF